MLEVAYAEQRAELILRKKLKVELIKGKYYGIYKKSFKRAIHLGCYWNYFNWVRCAFCWRAYIRGPWLRRSWNDNERREVNFVMSGNRIYWKTLPILIVFFVLLIMMSSCSTISCKVLSLDNICSWGNK